MSIFDHGHEPDLRSPCLRCYEMGKTEQHLKHNHAYELPAVPGEEWYAVERLHRDLHLRGDAHRVSPRDAR